MMHALAEAIGAAADTELVLIPRERHARFLRRRRHRRIPARGPARTAGRRVEGDGRRLRRLAVSGHRSGSRPRTLGAGVLIAALSDLVIAADNRILSIPLCSRLFNLGNT